VRTVGAAEDRFGEDRLRILRAIRFAGRFGSDLDPNVDAALQKDASLVGISGERIRDEFIKGIISAKSTDGYLLMLDKYKLFDWVFPNLNVDRRVFRRNLDYKGDDYVVLLARLLKDNSIEVLRKKLNELKYSADEIKAIVFLISLLKLDVNTAYLLKKIQQTSGVNNDQIRNFGTNEGISSQLLDAFENFRLTVTGPEAMSKFNIKPGPELGKAIEKMETDNFQKLL
jgi:tRNA nucleotidyltransferase/poly(A) polymerase